MNSPPILLEIFKVTDLLLFPKLLKLHFKNFLGFCMCAIADSNFADATFNESERWDHSYPIIEDSIFKIEACVIPILGTIIAFNSIKSLAAQIRNTSEKSRIIQLIQVTDKYLLASTIRSFATILFATYPILNVVWLFASILDFSSVIGLYLGSIINVEMHTKKLKNF